MNPAEHRHLLIDGYNAIHALEAFRPYLPRSLDLACSRLVEQVRVIHDVEALRTTVVFDGRGRQLEIERPGGVMTFSVIYSPADVSADGIIEQIVRRSECPPEVTVVSRDNLVAESTRAAGAVCIPPDELLHWMGRCAARQAASLQKRRLRAKAEEARHSPWSALDRLQRPTKNSGP